MGLNEVIEWASKLDDYVPSAAEPSWQSGPLSWELAARVWCAAIEINGCHFGGAWRSHAPSAPEPTSYEDMVSLEDRIHTIARSYDGTWDGEIARPFVCGFDTGRPHKKDIGLEWKTSVTTRLRRDGGTWVVEIVGGEHFERQTAAEATLSVRKLGRP